MAACHILLRRVVQGAAPASKMEAMPAYCRGGGSRRRRLMIAVVPVVLVKCLCVCLAQARPGNNNFRNGGRSEMPTPPSMGSRRGRGAGDGGGRPSGGRMGGNVFWKQWRVPVKTNGSLREDEDDETGNEYLDPDEGPAGEIETDNKPWTDLIPRVKVNIEPMTTLKLRKRFFPFKTVIELGADYNTQMGVWQFKSSWEDRIIGGRLSIKGRELQFSKAWLVTLGDQDDIATRLKFRAGIDTSTWRSYARLGFRTERIRPFSIKEGVTIRRRLPLDGNEGHAKLEVRANLCLPEPEIEYSTDKKRLIAGCGDIQLTIQELNLCLEY